MDSKQKARQRAEQIIHVRGGQRKVKEAAKNLGISRKSYYKWEKQALAAMIGALQDQSSGRPALAVDAEKEDLKRRLLEAEERAALLEQRLEIRDKMAEAAMLDPKKKERKGQAGRRADRGSKAETGCAVQGAVRAGGDVVPKADEVQGQAQTPGGAGSETGSEEVR